MATTYETDNYKSGVMEIRGVKRIWVYDKKTGSFAKLKGNTPIYSDENVEQDLVDKLESYGVDLKIVVTINYVFGGKFKTVPAEAQIEGSYRLKGEDFLVVKEIIENHLEDNKDILALVENAINHYLGFKEKEGIPFDDFGTSFEIHKINEEIKEEEFTTKFLFRGRSVDLDDYASSISQEVLAIIREVIR